MRPDPVEALLEEFLARQLDGVAEGLDEFCAAHPEHADALRRRIALLGALPAAAERAVPRSFDGFEIVRELGRGGMGVVFEARQARPERRVAIKLLTAGQELSERLRERFEREIAMLARIRHPNVVKVFGSGRAGDAPYVVMELVEGDSLARRAADVDAARRPGSWREAVRLCAKIARALDHVHELGVVHRDVKPSNVLIDAAGEPVLIDFGLARGADSDSITRSGEFVGTLAYTAPEQARGERADRRADVYGLGATLFHLATGAPPYRASSIAELLRQIDAGPPGSARSVNPDVPRDLATVLEHALALRPAERYASCADLAQDLNALLSGAPIAVRRQGVLARVASWARRRPTAAALTCALLALAGVSGVLGLRVLHERREARAHALELARWRALDLLLAPPLPAATETTIAAALDEDGKRLPGKLGPYLDSDLAPRHEQFQRLLDEFPNDRSIQWFSKLSTCVPGLRGGAVSRSSPTAEEKGRIEKLRAANADWIEDEPTAFVIELWLRDDTAALPSLQSIAAASSSQERLRAAATARALGFNAAGGAFVAVDLADGASDRALLALAALFMRESDNERAHRLDSVLTHYEPQSPRALISLARSQLEWARPKPTLDAKSAARSIANADEAVRRSPTDTSIMIQAGYIYHEAKPPGWESKAEEYYRRAIAVGDVPQARFNLHNLRWQLGLREPDSVIELLGPIEASYAHWGLYWQNLAWAYEKQGDVGRAVELLERSVALCAPEWLSEQLDWLIYMRGRLANGGDAAAQWRDFERLLDCTPQDTAGLERLFEAAKVVGGASRECVSEIIVERERAGVKLGKNAAALLEQIRKRR